MECHWHILFQNMILSTYNSKRKKKVKFFFFFLERPSERNSSDKRGSSINGTCIVQHRCGAIDRSIDKMVNGIVHTYIHTYIYKPTVTGTTADNISLFWLLKIGGR